MLSVGFYRENMPRFKAAFEDDELVLPKHEDIITDLGQIQIIRGVPGIDDSRTSEAMATSAMVTRRLPSSWPIWPAAASSPSTDCMPLAAQCRSTRTLSVGGRA